MSARQGAPRVAVVMVNYRTPDMALRAAASLECERSALPELRVVIADGGSGDGSADKLAEGVKDPALAGWVEALPLAINGGFGWANNQAIQTLLQSNDPPDYIHLLNPDTEVLPGAVSALAAVLDEEPRCAAAGSQLLNDGDVPSGSAFRFPSPGRELLSAAQTGAIGKIFGIQPVAFFATERTPADWVTGASVMLRAQALREAGLFDTGFFLYFEEVELMWRMRQSGWTVVHEPKSRVRHVGGAATGLQYNVTNKRPRLPGYWFQSRRRMFARTRGRGATVLAGLLWLLGHGVLRTRMAAGSAAGALVNERQARDLLNHGLTPSARDLAPAVAQWSDPVGVQPQWMADKAA